jgi:hypothetical protein
MTGAGAAASVFRQELFNLHRIDSPVYQANRVIFGCIFIQSGRKQ